MGKLSKEEKKALLKAWETAQNKKYVLSKAKVRNLFGYLETQLEKTPCNHTLCYTKQWICDHLPPEKTEAVIAELNEMGGFCDCEVLLNCYEEYDD